MDPTDSGNDNKMGKEGSPTEPTGSVKTTGSSGVDDELIQNLSKQISHTGCSMLFQKSQSKHIIYEILSRKSEYNPYRTARYIEPDNKPFTKGGLVFDKSLFRAGMNRDLGSDSKFILTQVSEKRSNDEVEKVRQELIVMGIKSFLDYPVWMQQNLIKIASFDVVTPYTVIISQGQPANKFFILLKGSVEVYAYNKANRSKKVLFLRRGDTFGETEMVNKQSWNATYTSKGIVEVLRIERDEMINILTQHNLLNEPYDHIKFLQRCDFTNAWPLDRLTDKHGCCIPYFFKRNTLIVEDSYSTDFLVVIRSGKCRVMCKLYKTVHQKSTKSQPVKDDGEKLNKMSFTYSRENVQSRSVHVETLKRMMNAENNDETQEALFKFGHHKQQYALPCKRDTCHEYSSDLLSNHAEPGKHNIKSEGFSSDARLEHRLHLPNRKDHSLRETAKEEDGYRTPVYIELETLKAKDVFGLETLGFDKHYDRTNSKGLFLVSSEDHRGVSVVMLSKSVFNAYASEKVVCNVQRLMKVYPDSRTIFEEIERQKLSANNANGASCDCFMGNPQNTKYTPWKY